MTSLVDLTADDNTYDDDNLGVGTEIDDESEDGGGGRDTVDGGLERRDSLADPEYASHFAAAIAASSAGPTCCHLNSSSSSSSSWFESSGKQQVSSSFSVSITGL